MTKNFKIYDDFEKTKKQGDMIYFSNKYKDNYIKFLLLRSFDEKNLKEMILEKYPEKKIASKIKLPQLIEIAFNNDDLTEGDIVNYIKKTYPKVSKARKEQEKNIKSIINGYEIVNCGVRNDKISDVVKTLVRNKDIKSKEELIQKIDEELLPKIKQYTLWSYYNQVTGDLIENFFNDHEKVIPTLRKIHNVDFFINVDGKITPFDLKVTHISDAFFDLYSEGLEKIDGNDDFKVKDEKKESEIKIIKECYASMKKKYKLQNYKDLPKGGKDKEELLDILKNTNDKNILKVVNDIYENRKTMVKSLETKPSEREKLVWWNYKNQGENLFSNNNRFYLFLVYKDKFRDAKEVKGNIELIEKEITELLNNITYDNIKEVKYHYEKDITSKGNYKANYLSAFICE